MSPSRFWEQYNWRVMAVLALIVAQTLIITFLLIERLRGRRSTPKLRESDVHLPSTFENSRGATLNAADARSYLRVHQATLDRKRISDLILTDAPDRAALYQFNLPAGRESVKLSFMRPTLEPTSAQYNASSFLASRHQNSLSEITERIRGEDNLARESSYLETMLENLPGFFFHYEGQGRFVRWNRNFERGTGYRYDEIVGMRLLDFFAGEDKQLILMKMSEVFHQGEMTAEACLLRKDGKVVPYLFNGRRIFFDGKPGVLGIGIDLTECKKAEQSLQQLTARLLQLLDDERRRIASELHDSLGQSLAIIKNRAMICLRAASDPERVKDQLEEISATAASAIDEVREITHNLRPYELDRLGLVEAIESMISKVSDSTSIRLSADLDRIEGLFTPEAEMGIYRIVQEGLNNVVRHAEASEARVSIKKVESEVIITVADNGKGIERSEAMANGKRARGFGLAGISERARMLGGTCLINSEPGCGTTLTVRLGLKGVINGG
ncbi:MAG: PAS domain-containing sensor histidine kinase [Acidobacteria bacterium]|nr:PAS domain-containing sensor histidine kinase [Acidobacteriota bacterium]